jgi:hypothetical protein
VRHAALPIWCDGIDDEVSDPFWGTLQSKKPDATLVVKVRISAVRHEPQIPAANGRAVDLRDGIAPVTSLLFRPRLFATRGAGRSDSANAH